MDADNRREKLFETITAFVKTEILDAYNAGYKDGERAGYDVGRLAGIEEGRGSASVLVAGLRSLLGKVEGGELAPAPEAVDLVVETAPAPAGEPIVKYCGGCYNPTFNCLCPDAEDREPEQPIAPAAGDDVVEVEQPLEPKAPAEIVTSFKRLTSSICDCALCGGFGTVEGELYDEPTLVPCICEAGKLVQAVGAPDYMEGLTRADGDQPFIFDQGVDEIPEVKEPAAVEDPAICFRLNCTSHDKNKATGCSAFENVEACPHKLNADAVVCGNLECSYFASGQPANCASIAYLMEATRVRKPATSCFDFKPAPDLTGRFDPALVDAADLGERGESFLCCSTCNVADPDCASCNLLENEINERNEAEQIAKAPAQDPTKCVNRNCTAIHPLPGKSPDVCLLLQGKDCANFSGVDEQGGASRLTSQEAEGVGQGAAELSPEAAHLLELQKTCKHPKVFIKTIPGRGEVCQLCDLVTTPESLPLFAGENEPTRRTPDAETYFAGGEDRREGDTFRETDQPGGAEAAPRPSCDHPFDLRQRNPDPKNGGFYVKCGGCGEIVNRLDSERRSIPRDQWPENQEAGKVVTIATGAGIAGDKGLKWGLGKGGRSLHLWRDNGDGTFTAACSDELTSPTFAATGGDYKQCPKCLKIEAEG